MVGFRRPAPRGLQDPTATLPAGPVSRLDSDGDSYDRTAPEVFIVPIGNGAGPRRFRWKHVGIVLANQRVSHRRENSMRLFAKIERPPEDHHPAGRHQPRVFDPEKVRQLAIVSAIVDREAGALAHFE